MTPSRHSTSSLQSSNATIVDPNSAPTSPREQHSSSDSTSPEPCTVTAGSSHSLHDSESGHSVSGEKCGWPQLAETMGEVPEFAAFSRFGDLNARNLLYYQVQLKLLRKKILEEEAKHNAYVSRYDLVSDGAAPGYHAVLMELRTLLREYNEALLQHSRVSALPDPEAYNISSLRRWLGKQEGADCSVRNANGADDTWGDVKEPGVPESLRKHFVMVLRDFILSKTSSKEKGDLVGTHPVTKIDGLSKWIVYTLVPLYWTWHDNRERIKPEQWNLAKEAKANSSGMVLNSMHFDTEAQGGKSRSKQQLEIRNTMKSMSESTAVRLTSSLSTVVACLLPVVAIAVLTQVKGERNLLLCITAFAIIFAVGLIALTHGTSTRTEIFAATAAFSAVLVVFISQPAVEIQWPPGVEPPVINL